MAPTAPAIARRPAAAPRGLPSRRGSPAPALNPCRNPAAGRPSSAAGAPSPRSARAAGRGPPPPAAPPPAGAFGDALLDVAIDLGPFGVASLFLPAQFHARHLRDALRQRDEAREHGYPAPIHGLPGLDLAQDRLRAPRQERADPRDARGSRLVRPGLELDLLDRLYGGRGLLLLDIDLLAGLQPPRELGHQGLRPAHLAEAVVVRPPPILLRPVRDGGLVHPPAIRPCVAASPSLMERAAAHC